MTISRHGDEDEHAVARRALELLTSEDCRPDSPDAREAARRFVGRPDALALLREVVVEERLLRSIRAEMARPESENARMAEAMQQRVLAALRPVSGAGRTPAIRRWLTLAIAAGVILAAGIVSNWRAVRELLTTTVTGFKPSSVYRVAETRAGELDTLDLPDGSRVILAPNTSVSYAVGARRGPRDVKLEGEAYFEVFHNEGRQFRVETHGAIVTDLGTSFVVREYPRDGRAQVVVRSGAASVESRSSVPTSSITMTRGDGAYIDAHGEISRFSGDPESYGAWTSGKLAFDGMALPEVLDRLGRWYDVEFRLADSTLSTQYFTGEFRSVPLAEALTILGPIVHARFAQEGRVVVVTSIPAGR